jgi:hypothetical protein
MIVKIFLSICGVGGEISSEFVSQFEGCNDVERRSREENNCE